MTIHELLERAIEERDHGNISAAAREMHTTRQTVYNWLRGVIPPMGKTKDVAAYCGVEEDYLLAMILIGRGLDPAILQELASHAEALSDEAKGVYLRSVYALIAA